MKVPPLIINLKNIKKKKNKKHKHKHKHHHSKRHHHNDYIENPPLLEPVELEGVDPNVSFLRTHDEDHHMGPISAPLPPPQPAPIVTPAPTPAPAPAPTPSPAPASAPITPVVRHEVLNGQVLDKSKEKTGGLEAQIEHDKVNDEASKAQKEGSAVQVTQTKPEPVVIQNKTTGAKISFLRMAEDGSVTMAIIGPMAGKPDDSNERIISLEQICGQLSDGTDVIPSNIDEEECRDAFQVKPVDFVEANAFGTYLPVEDSTFANLTKDDTETLLEIYGGNPTCYEYAKSLQDYAKGTNYLMTMVDSLLDLLTEGKHRKEAVPIREKLLDQKEEEQKQRLEEQESKVEEKQPEPAVITEESEPQVEEEKMEVDQAEEQPDEISKTSTTTDSNADPTTTITTTTSNSSNNNSIDDATSNNIAETTISNSSADNATEATTNNDVNKTAPTTTTDTTATDPLASETGETDCPEADNPEDIQKQLDYIEDLLNELKDVQERRLSSSAAPVEPDEVETRLADEVLSKMTKLIKEKAKPGEICSSDSIFKALGIPPLTLG